MKALFRRQKKINANSKLGNLRLFQIRGTKYYFSSSTLSLFRRTGDNEGFGLVLALFFTSSK